MCDPADRATALFSARVFALDGYDSLQDCDEVRHVFKDAKHGLILCSVLLQMRGDLPVDLALAERVEKDIKPEFIDQPLYRFGRLEELLVIEETIATGQATGAYILVFHLGLLVFCVGFTLHDYMVPNGRELSRARCGRTALTNYDDRLANNHS
jgi:hypothetical protein